MSRYVDIDKPVIVTIYNDPINDKKSERITTTIAELLRDTVDVLEEDLVRCKGCKWYQEGYDIDGKWFSRCNGSVRTYGHTKPNWFCGDGDREVTG